MSSDSELERILREARETLPGPDGVTSSRARALALAAFGRRRPRRVRAVAVLGAALVVVLAFGIGLGALVAPSGEAAKGPVGLGFLPERGWFAFQTGGEASSVFQTVAVASNIPLDPEDQVAGHADPSGLPYATLLKLPPEGIVIVASFTRASEFTRLDSHVGRGLPLLLSDATPIQYGTQVRPEDPLGQYQLTALVNDRDVNVNVYFGTPDVTPSLRAEAQRQLNRLVVGRTPRAAPATRPSAVVTSTAPGVLDRTFVCAPSLVGGVHQLDLRARRGSGKGGSGWDRPPFAAFSTTVSGSAATAIENELVWIAAGPPSADATVVSTLVGFTFPFRSWGSVAVNGKRCRASTIPAPLARKGLEGGAVGPFEDRWDCATGRRVVIHVRAVLTSRAALRSYRGFLRATLPVKTAALAVRTQSGRPLAYAEVSESGKASLYTAPSCFPD